MSEPVQAPESLTLLELIAKFETAVPFLDDKVEALLARNPHFYGPEGSLLLGRLLGAGILDFLTWAFDRPTLGYVPPDSRSGK